MMFIYRDEYYNRETEKQGVAEIQHRQAPQRPAGMHVELSFLSRFPKFANIARVERPVSSAAGEGPPLRDEPRDPDEPVAASGAARSAAATGSCSTRPATRRPASAARRACAGRGRSEARP